MGSAAAVAGYNARVKACSGKATRASAGWLDRVKMEQRLGAAMPGLHGWVWVVQESSG